MDVSDIALRWSPAERTELLTPAGVLVVLALTAVAVGWVRAWRVLRLGVTLVHELGHAAVGVLGGRRFTGFVLRGDMSGHAVTVGRPDGPAMVATTWAGYPAPALVGALLVVAGARGWAAPVLTVLLAALVVALLYVRSALTGAVVFATVAATGALWWWRDDRVQQHVVVGVGVLLLVGAWRHVGAVLGSRDPRSDAWALARLTGVPPVLWLGSFVLTLGLASWLAAAELLGAWS